jgi:uncharacterized protein (DUF983 family)
VVELKPASRALLLSRVMRLRCPRCGEEPMFKNWIQMHPQCKHCDFRYEREPGFFLGSIYVNYGLTAMISTIVYVWLRFGLEIDNKIIVWPLFAFCILFPVWFFRYARAYWLAMDCYFDRSNYERG